MSLLLNAAAWRLAGFSVVPIAADGTKRPAVPWKQYQEQPADEATIRAWFSDDRYGLGVVMGAVSGNAEMLELEGRAIDRITELGELADASGLGDVWGRVLRGYSEQSPSGGMHLIYRCPEIAIPGNLKLANSATMETLAETRGEGGQVVVAPTPGQFHPSGKPWHLWYGTPMTVPVITAEEREAIHSIVRTLDETPPAPEPQQPRVVQQRDDLSPGDDYESKVDWSEILIPLGWRLIRQSGRTRYWTRPGKTMGVSATTGRAEDRDRLYVFTSSTAFQPGVPYTKFGAYALLEHGGDYASAARALRNAGYGEPRPPRPEPVRAAPSVLPQPVAAPVDGTAAKVIDIEAKRDVERHIELTPASAIRPKRVKWLWQGRMAVGSISLLAGREGLGKSTMAYWTAARLTRGELPGEFIGAPKSVLVCATEDSWAHTIVPRLMAAGADLDRVYRVDVVSAEEVHVGLSLPRDVHRVQVVAHEVDAAMLLLDPLMSRIDAKLDTHRDGEVRLALEPLAKLAEACHMVVLGLIHLNKGSQSDILTAVMGSRAFAAVARSVCAVVRDPDDESGRGRLFGTPKNNLGPDDLPLLSFTVESHPIDTDDGVTYTGRIEWRGEVDGSIDDAMSRAMEDPEVRTAVAEAADWLQDYLASSGGECDSASVKEAAKRAHINESTLARARKRLRIKVESIKGVSPRRTLWSLNVKVTTKSDTSRVTAFGESE